MGAPEGIADLPESARLLEALQQQRVDCILKPLQDEITACAEDGE